jgi:hypothetical protein
VNTVENVPLDDRMRNAPRTTRWTERKRRGVLFISQIETYPIDLVVLQRCGLLPTADPALIDTGAVERAIAALLDRMAQRLGIVGAAPETPAAK